MSVMNYSNWGATPATEQYALLLPVLKKASAPVCLDIACDSKPHGMKKGRSVTMRRYQNLAVNATAVGEGLNPAARTLSGTDYSGTLVRYAELFVISRENYDLNPIDEVEAAQDELSENLIPATRERIRWNAAKSITTIYYDSEANTLRTQVNGVITLGRLQKATRVIKSYRGMEFQPAIGAAAKDGTSSVEKGFYAFCSTDLEPDLRNIPGFKTVNDYPTGRGVHPNEFGAVQNVRFITSSEFKPYENGGAASTTMIATSASGSTSGSADVYPIVILGKHALTQVPLRGRTMADNVNLRVKKIEGGDSADPTGARVYVTASWYDLCVVTSNEWGAVIEVAATRNP